MMGTEILLPDSATPKFTHCGGQRGHPTKTWQGDEQQALQLSCRIKWPLIHGVYLTELALMCHFTSLEYALAFVYVEKGWQRTLENSWPGKRFT